VLAKHQKVLPFTTTFTLHEPMLNAKPPTNVLPAKKQLLKPRHG
jgi:hypothetical protein